MAKGKLQKFADMREYKNVVEHPYSIADNVDFNLRGNWKKEFFGNNNPIVIELGCGRGEYTVALARRHPEKNFIGVDIKGARMWTGATEALRDGLSNVGFLRTNIEVIDRLFASGEVSEIWVTFPDPQPKKERRRLVSPNFVSKYRQVIQKNGLLHLKTDSRELYEYYLETIDAQGWNLVENIEDVYADGTVKILTEIQTFYEKMWLAEGKQISYICADNLFSEKREKSYQQ
jgi:tRNA (guanine-N7-)-methyltransferase